MHPTTPETFTRNLLNIQMNEGDDSIVLMFLGKSVDRTPSEFIAPILSDALSKSKNRQKRVVLDFRNLQYMNSSTITPIIKVLDRAKRGTDTISVIYDGSLKWQDLSFSALSVFESEDRRVEIKGL